MYCVLYWECPLRLRGSAVFNCCTSHASRLTIVSYVQGYKKKLKKQAKMFLFNLMIANKAEAIAVHIAEASYVFQIVHKRFLE